MSEFETFETTRITLVMDMTRMAKNFTEKKNGNLKLWSASRRFFLPSKSVQNLVSFVLQITLTLFVYFLHFVTFFLFLVISVISNNVSGEFVLV